MSKKNHLKEWIINDAIPNWYYRGLDKNMGFFEALDYEKNPILLPRRTRLVARQIYSFILAKELGWDGPYEDIVEHGLNFLEKFLITEEGQVFKNINLQKKVVDKGIDLYDYSFLFLALARVALIKKFRQKSLLITKKSLNWLNQKCKHNLFGYFSDPNSSMNSNPHMHLFEAAIEWIRSSTLIGNKKMYEKWKEIAYEMVLLASTKLIDRKDGSLSENFDINWNSEQNKIKKIIEPGHNYEWGWLLLRWGKLSNSIEFTNKAKKLIFIAESKGLLKNKLVISELDGYFNMKNKSIKLWPQTERLKAWHFLSNSVHDNKEEQILANLNFENSIKNLFQFIEKCPKGMWIDSLTENMIPCNNYSKASSLYHIILAIHSIFHI